MDILPISPSKKGLYEDEIKRGGYFPMQNFKLIDNQLFTVLAVQIRFNFNKSFQNFS